MHQTLQTNLAAAEHSLLGVSDQALLAEEVAVGALGHLLEGELAVAAAALDQLTVLGITHKSEIEIV